MDKKNKVDKEKIMDIATTLRQERFNGPTSDVLGSYTGTPVFGDVPEQDQDDL